MYENGIQRFSRNSIDDLNHLNPFDTTGLSTSAGVTAATADPSGDFVVSL